MPESEHYHHMRRALWVKIYTMARSERTETPEVAANRAVEKFDAMFKDEDNE